MVQARRASRTGRSSPGAVLLAGSYSFEQKVTVEWERELAVDEFGGLLSPLLAEPRTFAAIRAYISGALKGAIRPCRPARSASIACPAAPCGRRWTPWSRPGGSPRSSCRARASGCGRDGSAHADADVVRLRTLRGQRRSGRRRLGGTALAAITLRGRANSPAGGVDHDEPDLSQRGIRGALGQGPRRDGTPRLRDRRHLVAGRELLRPVRQPAVAGQPLFGAPRPDAPTTTSGRGGATMR